MSTIQSPNAPGQVLSTLNQDGTRLRIRPHPSRGRFWRHRRALAWVLMAVFLALPYLRIADRPAVLLDLPRREFTLFGTTFLPTETLLFMLLVVSCIIAIFVFTALFGRVWCGWACPQTVYLEFLYRPIEQWLEGGRRGSIALDGRGGLPPRRLLKLLIYGALSALLAHVFLAYFVGVDQLAVWMRRSPIEHPTSFLVMLGTTGMIFADFAWFREQTCLVACPYGRLQSVLLDRRSRIVGYDPRRGEPRAKGTRHRAAGSGDCIDCRMCVITCPTGIDIREGLQMECVHCTQCIDACDAVMRKIGKPPGLIRYSSRDQLAGRPSPLLRPRVVLYPLALAVAVGLLLFNLGTRADAEVTLLHGLGAPYAVAADGSITNLVRIKVTNRARAPRRFTVGLTESSPIRLVAPVNGFAVEPGRTREVSVFVIAPAAGFTRGEREVTFRVSDDHRFSRQAPHLLVGPEFVPETKPRESEVGS